MVPTLIQMDRKGELFSFIIKFFFFKFKSDLHIPFQSVISFSCPVGSGAMFWILQAKLILETG